MSAAETLLDRLQRVKQVAPGRWIASCPLHNTKGQALSIRETSDGRVLLHDFGGCGTDDVLAALGLTVADLFNERLPDAKPGKPNHWHARKEAFQTIHKPALIVALAGESLAAGVALTLEDRDCLSAAARHIRHVIEVCR
jgi:hypothetical protein